jgi:sugar fermentation stimulation protein A
MSIMSDYIYRYPPLEAGILLRRYKRFFADIELTSGNVITAHCPNTGPMTGVSTPGSLVQVSRSDNPKRKLPYTWEMIQVNDTQPTWVGVNTGLPNQAIAFMLKQRLLPELGSSYNEIRREVPYGKDQKSRVDFLLTSDREALGASAPLQNTHRLSEAALRTATPLTSQVQDVLVSKVPTLMQKTKCFERPIYLEVKSATLAIPNVALFPDTVTTRGQKHLRELMALLPDARAVMLYFINRGDCSYFAPGDSADPVYGQLLREAVARGVEVLACRFEITPEGIRYLGLAKFLPMQPLLDY